MHDETMKPDKEGDLVWPCYILFDESASLNDLKLEAVKQTLQCISLALITDPLADLLVRLGVVTFSDAAEESIPLSKLSDLSHLLGAVSRGGSNYTAAFTTVKLVIDRDIPYLRSVGFRVLRPFIYFISDGKPTSTDWLTAHAALMSSNNQFAPNILSCGVTGAVGEVIKEVAALSRNGHRMYWLADEGIDLAGVVRECIREFGND